MAAPSSIPTSYPRMASTPHARHRLARTPGPHAHMHSPSWDPQDLAEGHKLDGVKRPKGLGPTRHVSLSEASAPRQGARRLARSRIRSAGAEAGAGRGAAGADLRGGCPRLYSGKRWRSAKHRQ